MTRKDYVCIAEALKYAKPKAATTLPYALRQWERDVACIADALADDNGRFNRSRFYAACGLDLT